MNKLIVMRIDDPSIRSFLPNFSIKKAEIIVPIARRQPIIIAPTLGSIDKSAAYKLKIFSRVLKTDKKTHHKNVYNIKEIMTM